jgi:hypothetical protein
MPHWFGENPSTLLRAEKPLFTLLVQPSFLAHLVLEQPATSAANCQIQLLLLVMLPRVNRVGFDLQILDPIVILLSVAVVNCFQFGNDCPSRQ